MNLMLLLLTDYIKRIEAKTVDGVSEVSGTIAVSCPDRRFHHIQDVLHSKVGDSLKVGDLNGLVGTATVILLTDSKIELDVRLSEKPTRPSPVTLMIAMPHKDALLKIIHTATILGVKRIVFINSLNATASTWSAEATKNQAIRETLLLGLEQTVDTVLPTVQFYRDTDAFTRNILPDMMVDAENYILARQPSTTVDVDMADVGTSKKVNLVVGPDVLNFTVGEQNKFIDLGFRTVSFGRRVLPIIPTINILLGRLGFSADK